MIEYRDLTADDIDGLMYAASSFFKERGTIPDQGVTRDILLALIAHEDPLVYGAVDGPFVLGFIVAEVVPDLWTDTKVASEHGFYTLPQYRKKGIGGVIISHFLTWAEERGASARLMINGNVDDDKAVAMLERYGFKKSGVFITKEFV